MVSNPYYTPERLDHYEPVSPRAIPSSKRAARSNRRLGELVETPA